MVQSSLKLPHFSAVKSDIRTVGCDVLIVNLFQGVKTPGGATGAVDKALNGMIRQAINDGELTGKKFETRVFHTGGLIPARRVLVVGLGPSADFDYATAHRVAAAAARAAAAAGGRKVATIVHGAGIGGLAPEEAARVLIDGTCSGIYRFDRYKSKSGDNGNHQEQHDIDEFIVVEVDEAKLEAVKRGIETGKVLASATAVARDLANEPPNVLTPLELAERARQIASSLGLNYRVWSGQQLEEAGFKAIYAVGKGSQNEPQFIRIDYKGRKDDLIDLALVGKGVTFDTGGISLKPAESMEEMKFDMSGAAAVLAAAIGVAQLKPEINVMFLIPTVENMPGGQSLRPGDIIETIDGKTIEVVNTDAEGRLILSDAIAYARQEGARAIVDVATLTGAAIIALGHQASAIMGNNENLLQEIEAAANWAGEWVWRLPTWSEYKEQLKSNVADIKNTGGRPAGTITGGLFVGSFAGDTPWVHVDIAGTAWITSNKPFAQAGATGVMTRTLIRLCTGYGAGRRA